MPTNRPDARRTWRPGARALQRESAGGNWRRGGGNQIRTEPTVSRSRLWRIVLGLSAMTLIYALLWFVLLWFQPIRQPNLVIIQEGYETDLAVPHNTYGLNTAAALEWAVKRLQPESGPASWLRPRVGFAPRIGKPRLTVNLNVDDIARELPDGVLNKKGATLIYLTARSGTRAGKPYLLCERSHNNLVTRTSAADKPPGADRDEAFRALPQCDLIEFVKSLAKKKNHQFCLILDVLPAPTAFPLTIPEMGNLVSLRELQNLPEIRSNASNVDIIAPADHRATMVSRDWRQTVFGHAIIQGLAGAAAGESDRISAARLTGYIQERIELFHGSPTVEKQTSPVWSSGTGLANRSNFLLMGLDRERSGLDTTRAEIPEPWKQWVSAAWQRYQVLDKQVSFGPYVISPLTWRHYRDQILRFEDLVQSVDPFNRPADQTQQLLDLFRADLDAMEKSFANSRELPWTHSTHQSLVSMIPSESDGNLTSSSKTSDSTAYADLLDQSQQVSTAGDFDQARETLSRLAELDHPRPVEAHFLALILRDQFPGARSDADYHPAFTHGLLVRRLAEQAALGGGAQSNLPARVVPWLTDLVIQGDTARRSGEDRLLGSNRDDWRMALDFFRAAETHYRAAIDQAAILNDAFTRRDLALADLPYYSNWASLLPAEPDGSGSRRTDLVKSAWVAAHDLAVEFLDDPGPNQKSDSARKRAAIQGKSEALHQLLEAIKAEFDRTLDAGTQQTEILTTPKSREDQRARLWAVLMTPFPDPDLRPGLFDSLASLQRGELITDLIQSETTESVTGQRAAMLMLAAIGDGQFDQGSARSAQPDSPELIAMNLPVIGPIDSFETFQKRLNRLAGFDPTDQAKTTDFRGCVNQIAWVQLWLAKQLTAKLKPTPAGDLDAWPRTTLEADLIGRQLLGSQWSSATPTAAQLARLCLVQRLLNNQAQRVWRDHYFSANEANLIATSDPLVVPRPEYFQKSILAYIQDIDELETSRGLRREGFETAIRPLQEKANQRGELVVANPSRRLVVTDQPNEPIEYPIEPGSIAAQVGGSPVFWLEADGPTSDLAQRQPTTPRRFVALSPPDLSRSGNPSGTGPSQFAFDIPFAGTRLDLNEADQAPLKSGLPAAQTIHFEGRFRGQVFRQKTEVELYSTPDIVVRRDQPPLGAALAVIPDQDLLSRYGRSDGGSLAIILDCSGSMGPPPNALPDAPSKFREIMHAVEQILARLAPGTTVSVYIFGQQILSVNPNPPAEETITQIVPPTVWRSDAFNQVREVMARIEAPRYQPFNRSPIVKTMLRARDDLAGVQGFRSILVLTDGKDTSYEGKPPRTIPTGDDVASVLRANFGKSDIELTVVGFKVADDQDEIRKQFGVIETFPRPGQFFTVNDAVDLTRTLNKALRPALFYRLDGLNNVPILGPVRIGERAPGSLDFLRLDPGSYRLQLDADVPGESIFHVEPGDHLAVRMLLRSGRVAFERLTWTTSLNMGLSTILLRNHWRLSVLQNQITTDGHLTFQTSLELEPDQDEKDRGRVFPRKEIALVRPRTVWLELADGPKSPPVVGQRWRTRFDWAAPVWEAQVAPWPKTDSRSFTKPVLRAWWAVDNLVPTATMRLDPGERLDLVQERRTSISGLDVESITTEQAPIDRLDGLPARESYLVVRIRSPRNQPYWVDLIGVNPVHVEHRFYHEANRSTAIFGPWNEAMTAAVTGLAFHSVDKFKERAASFGLTSTDLSIPNPPLSDPGPSPLRLVQPRELKNLPALSGP